MAILTFSILGISWFWFLGALILTQLPLYVQGYLHGDETTITTFLAIFSIGIGIGSILCDRISHGDIRLRYVFVGSLGISFFTVPLYSLLQKASDVERRSRTIAANSILNAVFMVVASIFGC